MAPLKKRLLYFFLCTVFFPTLIGARSNSPTSTSPVPKVLLPHYKNGFPSRDLRAPAPVLAWNTFLGENNGTDYGLGIVVDGSGNSYITGISNAAWGAPVRVYSGGSDAFVAKLDTDGNLVWSTFLGGSASNDYGEEIILDGSGNVYVTGLTDVSFGIGTWGSPIRPFAGQGDAFVAKLDSSGNLLWNTFLGSGVTDWGKGLVISTDGNLYVTGFSDATWGAPVVRPFTAIVDAFVAKLDLDGNLQWTSFFGGVGFDEASSISTDSNGRLYLAGASGATVGSASWGNPVRDYSGGGDAFVATLDSSGNLIWNTFMGGSGQEIAAEAAVDGTGKVYVTGLSNAPWGNPIRGYTAAIDVFAALLDSSGNLSWNTFLGGNGIDEGYGIDTDRNGNAYISGYSTATWGNPLLPFTALYDAFEANLDPAGNLAFHLFLGGTGADYGYGLDVDRGGTVFIAGSSTAAWGSPVDAYTPPTDAFVIKFGSPPLVVSTSLKPTMNPGPASFTVTFNKDVSNPPGNTTTDDATNPNNYLLIDKGQNGTFDTTSCANGLVVDDERVTATAVTYNTTSFTSTITLAGALPTGKYRLIVCGTTSIVDLSGNALAGDGVRSGTDYTFDFIVNSAATPTSTATTPSLPRTGFAPRVVSALPAQPTEEMYSSLGDLWLEIPSQGLKTSIVGVPQSEQGWDVTWLGDNVGWLNGTAFPTWDGNSVLTGHAHNANGLPGPFSNLNALKYGERLIVHLAGAKYIFEVQSMRISRPASTGFAFQHLEGYSYLTLVTCQGYNPLSDSYLFRRIVRAVLVDIQPE